jgi:hypothetical protein
MKYISKVIAITKATYLRLLPKVVIGFNASSVLLML